MGKVYGIHEIELQPGVNEEAFANFINQEFNEAFAWIKVQRVALLKGDRGERAGKYALLFEIDSLEARDSTQGAEGHRWYEEHKELVDSLLKKLASFTPTDLGEEAPFYTDYVELD
jgi:hypothetical protein